MQVPNKMSAVEIVEPGGPEVLATAIRPVPEPRAHEVLIKVEAAGVNRPDCLQRAGLYAVPTDADPLPGLEVAGQVVALGVKASRFSVGDKVCALVHGGGYAQYARADEGHCLSVPSGMTTIEAASIPETYFTVYYNMVTRAQLVAGETLLVHGGSSGIGTTAIQLAKAWGATVVTTAGNEAKCDFCKELGADLAINYRSHDFETAVQEHTGGVDIVLDMVAGPYIQKNINLLNRDGRYIFIAFLGGPKAEVNFLKVLRDRLTLTGSTLRPQTVAEKSQIADGLARDVWPLFKSGKLKTVVHSTFPLQEAGSAHALMESSQHMGKIILTVS